MAKKKTEAEKEELRQIKALIELFETKGITVRRENLSRVPSFKVKSGECLLTGENILFLDKRLPNDQQISVLVDYLFDSDIAMSPEEIQAFPKQLKSLIESNL